MANTTTPRRTGQPRRATGNPRTGFTPRPRPPARRGKQQQSKGGGVLSAVMKALPSSGTAKAKASGAKKPGGLALLAGAGGLAAAVSQRGRIKEMRNRRGGGDAQTGTVTDPVSTVTGPDSATTVTDGPAGTVTDGPAGTQPGPNAV